MYSILFYHILCCTNSGANGHCCLEINLQERFFKVNVDFWWLKQKQKQSCMYCVPAWTGGVSCSLWWPFPCLFHFICLFCISKPVFLHQAEHSYLNQYCFSLYPTVFNLMFTSPVMFWGMPILTCAEKNVLPIDSTSCLFFSIQFLKIFICLFVFYLNSHIWILFFIKLFFWGAVLPFSL